MRWHLLSLIAALAVTSPGQCQQKDLTEHRILGTNSLSSLEALLVGTWRWDVPAQEETNAFMKLHLLADRSWSWSIHSDNPRAVPDEESGTWFVHERILVLRISKTKARFFEKIAWPCDIKSVTPETLVVTNSPLGDVTWTRVAQP